MNNEYKKEFIKRFIKKNSRAPSVNELSLYLKEKEEEFLNLDKLGLSQIEKELNSFGQEASLDREKNRLSNYTTDLKASKKVLIEIKEKLGFYRKKAESFFGIAKQRLLDVNRAMDLNLLSLNKVDQFVCFAIENFNTLENVYSTSTISIENGYCKIGDLDKDLLSDNVKTSFAVSSTVPVTFTVSGNLEQILEGKRWDVDIYSTIALNEVSLILDFSFESLTYLDSLVLNLNPITVNRDSFVSVLGKKNNSYFKILDKQALINPEVFVDLKTDLENIRIVFEKTSYDSNTTTLNQFIYKFSLNSVALFSSSKQNSDSATLIWSKDFSLPFYGTLLNYNPNFVKLDCCTIEPEGTGINWFVGLTSNGPWTPIHRTDNGSTIISLGYSETNKDSDIYDVSKEETQLLRLSDYGFGSSYCFSNVICTSQNSINTNTLIFKRNCKEYGDLTQSETINNVPRGWYYNIKNNRYKTTIYNNSQRLINLGSSSAWLNGRIITGEVVLPTGYSVFETLASNFYDIPDSLPNEKTLSKADPLYPFNHRFLIEGYVYVDGFSGSKIYTGSDEIFGSLLKLVEPDELTSSEQFSIITKVQTTSKILFITKVDDDDSYWDKEICKVSWQSRRLGDAGKVWLKADLFRNTEGRSPAIDWFVLRGV